MIINGFRTYNSLLLLGLIALICSFSALRSVHSSYKEPGNYRGNDIYHIWTDGYRIAHAENPYSRIHDSDMLINKKYSTYLPGFFLIISAYVASGHESFEEWLAVWKPVGFLLHCAIGALIFFSLLGRSGFVLAFFGSQFWLLSRWPIGIMNSGQIDGLSILLLIVSLLTLPKNRRTALVIFGMSLSIKQIGIFMLPALLLCPAGFSGSPGEIVKSICRDLFWICLVPFIVCLPFIVWDAKGLLMSLLFSATRSPGGHIKVPSIDELLGYVGIVAKLPMFCLMGFIYLALLMRKISIFMAALALYLVFVSFNSVLFKQYMPWFCAFLGFAMAEFEQKRLRTD